MQFFNAPCSWTLNAAFFLLFVEKRKTKSKRWPKICTHSKSITFSLSRQDIPSRYARCQRKEKIKRRLGKRGKIINLILCVQVCVISTQTCCAIKNGHKYMNLMGWFQACKKCHIHIVRCSKIQPWEPPLSVKYSSSYKHTWIWLIFRTPPNNFWHTETLLCDLFLHFHIYKTPTSKAST